MGTRADFYVGRGEQAEWLGSIPWDGYPAGAPSLLIGITDEAAYRKAVEAVLSEDEECSTRPEQGWPWPWEDSRTTDYAYAFDDGCVWWSCFGREWRRGPELEGEYPEEAPKTAVFPDMSKRKAVTFGPRSGLLVFRS